MGRVVLVAGASGLVGSSLVGSLQARGDEVRTLVRREPTRPGEYAWDPGAGELPDRALDGVDAVVNLCGSSIAAIRWTADRRRAIRASRVEPTHLLARACARRGVRVLVNAGATGFHGDRGEEILEESSASGGGFLADTCVAWECALRPAELEGVRVAVARFGVVLSSRAGALRTMLPAFRFGLGGRLGPGTQWFPWIHLEDAVGVLLHLVDRDSCQGPHLAVSPEAVRQGEFARTLGRVLGRPAILPVPRFVLERILGGVARELLLASQRCLPRALLDAGFLWRHARLEAALEDLLPEG